MPEAVAGGIAVKSSPVADPKWVASDLTWITAEDGREEVVRVQPDGKVVTSRLPPPGPVAGLSVRASSTRALLGSATHLAVVRDVYACYPALASDDTTSCVYVPEVLAGSARGGLRRVAVGSPCELTDVDHFALAGDTVVIAAPEDACRTQRLRRWRLTEIDLRDPQSAPREFSRPLSAAVRVRAAGLHVGWSLGSSPTRIFTREVRALRSPRRIPVRRLLRPLANWALQRDGTIVLATARSGLQRVSLARVAPRSTVAKPLNATAADLPLLVANDTVAVLRGSGVGLVDFRGHETTARVRGLPRPRSFSDFDGRRLAWTSTSVLEPPVRCPESPQQSSCIPSPGRTRTTIYGGSLVGTR